MQIHHRYLNQLRRCARSHSNQGKNRHSEKVSFDQGLTLLEILVVLLIIGAIAAIAAPSWISFLNNQKLITARNQVFDVLRQAQSTAKLQHIGHDTKFRQSGDRVEWVIHPVGDTELSTAELLTLPWNTLAEQVQLDPETTLYRKDNVYRVRFNDYGEVNGQLGRVTLSVTSGQVRKRCVIVSSLLGAMRTGESQPQKKDPKCD